ncbi:putative Ig domain-containing protein [Stenotrophomonas maltophilia]|uniref:Ig domain-containing protein n=1 Tax=Stenotrophomonas maltophilia TaxID=40324 RepID=A0AAJ2JFC7_STEMA|nr:putative Ig domain-containing protein [Stenotrophomonas maltophilia]MDT3468922.1 putative Ig domain-containing protein [Stenotrophomonas maltophilia]
MRSQPVDLIGGFYKDDSLPWSCQDTVNWLPVMAEVSGTRSLTKLATAPGLKPWLTVGAGQIRGMHDLEGGRFVVSGQTLCRINPNNTVDPIGTIPGVGRVQMTHNQFKTGFQLLVENGQGGGGYVFNSGDGTFGRITDEGYPGSISSDYLDSFLLGVEPLGRFWFHSNLADATDYNTLDRYEAEASPDKIVGLAANASEVVVFGQRTTEFFFNTGQATGTFQNRKSSIARGCASRYTIQKLDNSVFWLGDDGVVYRLDGYAARPVSTRVLDRAIANLNWGEAFAEVWEDRGHKVYYLTFPDGQTFGYDVVSGLWHRRESFGLSRWRLSHMQKWGGTWYGGDFQSGRIWEIDWDYILEGDDPLVRRRVSPASSDNQSALVNPNAELVFDVGRGPETVAVSFPSSISISGNPPGTLVGLTYPAFSFTASGGTSPYTFSLVGGVLPPGLVLSSSGAITGSASTGGQYRFRVRVYDSKNVWNERDASVTVTAGLLALATPTNLYTGQYESLVATAAISDDVPNGSGAFAISPSSVYVFKGLSSSPWGKLLKINSARTGYAESSDITLSLSGAVSACDFSSDGKYLALVYVESATRKVIVYKLESGVWARKSEAAISGDGQAVRWSPDGKYIAVRTMISSPQNGFRVFNFNSSTDQLGTSFAPSSAMNAQAPSGFGWSPDSKYIAEWSANRMNAWEVSPTSVAYRSSTPSPYLDTSGGAHFSQDGKFIYGVVAFSSGNKLAAYPFSDGVIGQMVVGASQPAFQCDTSAISGDYLAVSRFSNSTTDPRYLIYKCVGTSITPIANQPAPVGGPRTNAIRWTI